MYTKTKTALTKLFLTIMPVAITVMLLASCKANSEEVSMASNTCYISNVSFNSFKRELTTKASDGVTDSTYYSTYTASSWIFTIDHKNLSIENRDSLPYKTDLSRAVMNMSYTGGVAYYRSSDAWNDDAWITYQSTDSIDLRKPLHIKVVATDRTERIYTLRVNVHTVESDSLKWVAVNSNDILSGEHPMKAIALENQVAVFVNDGNAVVCMTHDNNNSGDWNRIVTNLPLNSDLNSIVKGESNIYVNTENGELYSSQDGITWTMLCQQDGIRLAGVSKDKLYAMFGGTIHSTNSGAINWTTETLDEDASLLPDKETATLTYAQTSDITRMIIVGNRSAETENSAVVWSKSWTSFENENTETWMHYNRNWDKKGLLPMFTQMNLMQYDKKLIIAAGQSADGTIKALERLFVSQDNGLTWTMMQSIIPPTDIQGASGHLTSIVDSDNFIWLIAGGKIYRGRINRLGFERA